MKKFWDKVWEIIPVVWGALWLLIITFGSVALVITTFKWLLSALGGM